MPGLNTLQRMNSIALKPFRKITMADIVRPGPKPQITTCLQVSRITADELTVRFSRRCHEISRLPQNIAQSEAAQKIISLYTRTCQELFEYTDRVEDLRRNPNGKRFYLEEFGKYSISSFFRRPIPIPAESLAPKDQDLENIKFGSECNDPILAPLAKHLTMQLIDILERAVERHKQIMFIWANEYSTMVMNPNITQDQIQTFLHKFHYQRIAVRLLIGHCVALYRPLPLSNMVGVFCTDTPIEDIVMEAVAMAEDVCELTYGIVPPITVKNCSKDPNLFYIPSHLQHIVFELVKNGMRAVLEKDAISNHPVGIKRSKLPPIEIEWTDDEESVLMSIKDCGTGIAPELLANVFKYHYTTAKTRKDKTAPMAGYGYGLPLSRLYAQFLKGNVWLETEYGKGTTSYLKLKKKWNPTDLI